MYCRSHELPPEHSELQREQNRFSQWQVRASRPHHHDLHWLADSRLSVLDMSHSLCAKFNMLHRASIFQPHAAQLPGCKGRVCWQERIYSLLSRLASVWTSIFLLATQFCVTESDNLSLHCKQCLGPAHLRTMPVPASGDTTGQWHCMKENLFIWPRSHLIFVAVPHRSSTPVEHQTRHGD